jgi:predicted O-methyltransferase YrrM
MTDLKAQEALALSRNITEWLEEAEAKTLYHYAVELGPLGPILEIGSWHGKSTIVLATAAQSVGSRVFAVDPHKGINYWQDRFGPMHELGTRMK